MKKCFTVAIALLSGLLGGVASRYLAPQTVFAQNQSPVTKEVRAQSFALVDFANRTMGKFTVEAPPAGPAPARIVLRDANGHEIWSAGGTGMMPLNITSK